MFDKKKFEEAPNGKEMDELIAGILLLVIWIRVQEWEETRTFCNFNVYLVTWHLGSHLYEIGSLNFICYWGCKQLPNFQIKIINK